MPDVPPYNDMLWVTLRVLISLGGSASIGELDQAVIAAAGWTEDQQQVLHNDDRRPNSSTGWPGRGATSS